MIRKCVVMCFALLLAVSAFAGDRSTVNLTLSHKVVVSGTTLQPGDYKVMLEGSGEKMQATFVSGRKTVATTSARFESRSAFLGAVTAVYKDHDQALQEIDVKKMNGAIVFGESAKESAETR